jgi:hypothetical protein
MSAQSLVPGIGWKLFVTSPTTNPIMKAIACAVVSFVVIYAGLWLSFGPPSDPARISAIVSGLVVIPAIIVGLWARNSAKASASDYRLP